MNKINIEIPRELILEDFFKKETRMKVPEIMVLDNRGQLKDLIKNKNKKMC